MENRKLVISQSPHIRSSNTTQRIMLDVVIALLPALIAGTVLFGLRALFAVAVCAASAVGAEFVFNLILKKPQTVSDLSALVTGVLLGLNNHVLVPIWQCVLGSVFAVIVVKCLFGGLGYNFANPAITARVVLVISFTSTVGGGVVPGTVDKIFFPSTDLITTATPLVAEYGMPGLWDLFIGNHAGAIGETCALALIIGYAYLVVRRVIKFETPIIFIGTVFVLSLIASGSFYLATAQVLSGGLILGAVFMATDYVTTPITRTGKMIFAFGCGLFTFLIRYFGSYPEGVSFAILFMNILSPYIEKWTAKRPIGAGGK